MEHKSGFVNIIGNPNVGKSTIMNALVGDKLSIITSKAQTTRHRIMGIVNGEDFQIVYSDTPGILRPNYKLQESMMKSIKSALIDADILLYVTDVMESMDRNPDILEKIKKLKIPTLVILNKIDLSGQDEVRILIGKWLDKLPQAEIIPLSAINFFNMEKLLNRIIELLPPGPPYFPKDQITDRTERFFVSEMIREKILMQYRKEIPYSVEVEVSSFKEEKEIIRIMATIHVLRDSQKGIIIGHKGQSLKRIGKLAREDMERFFNKKIFLELFVKVNKDWRNKERLLKKFGY
ncbi:MAG: GTPase Era [Bacteroidales bacterium]|nr:MAG: GTPase Era [Bacteroidales bacterium]